MLDNIREQLRAVPKGYPGRERALEDADTIRQAYLDDELVIEEEGFDPADYTNHDY